MDRADSVDPEHEELLADSVGLALRLVLETLTPPERLTFVLMIRLSPLCTGTLSAVAASRTASTSAGGRRRALAACWCARTILASAAAVNLAPRFVAPGAQLIQDLPHVPSPAQRRCRL
jgi:hypothetical protein